MSGFFHSRTALPWMSWTAGAEIFAEVIHSCKVARDILAARAACSVVQVFIARSFSRNWTPVKNYFCFYRVHQTLRLTPTIEAGISDHVWEVEEIVALLEQK